MLTDAHCLECQVLLKMCLKGDDLDRLMESNQINLTDIAQIVGNQKNTQIPKSR